jgi:hypothetical protein
MSSVETPESSMKEQNTVIEKPSAESCDVSKSEETQVEDRGFRFWAIFAALSITGLLAAIEATIISTALPTIVHNLNVGNNYAWIANAYFLTRFV